MTNSMSSPGYSHRRETIATYFDETAVDAWARLTSDEPVGRIRQTVRKGRDEMREQLLAWLPSDMRGKRLLDAGCGTGALAFEAAMCGADVVGVDISPRLVELAAKRAPESIRSYMGGCVNFSAGDFADAELGEFDYVVAMDSLIHYPVGDIADLLERLARRTRCSIVFTHAPDTKLLSLMHTAGKYFPKSDRAPSIVPVKINALRNSLERNGVLEDWTIGRQSRISSGFYKSNAVELIRR